MNLGPLKEYRVLEPCRFVSELWSPSVIQTELELTMKLRLAPICWLSSCFTLQVLGLQGGPTESPAVLNRTGKGFPLQTFNSNRGRENKYWRKRKGGIEVTKERMRDKVQFF